MRISTILIAAFGISGQAQAKDCSTLENPIERLACYDETAPSTLLPSTSTVSGNVTWQYNDYVGSKGDVGAKVFLVPHPLNGNLEKLKSHSNLSLESALSIYGSKIGSYKAKADGYGKFSISGVEGGTYDVLIMSRKAKTYPDGKYNAYCRSKYASFSTKTEFQFEKVSCKPIIVRSGLNTMHSHDFGNTER